MKNISKITWGFILIVLGTVIAMNSLGYTNIDIFFDGWWTMFIIIPSITGLLYGKNKKDSFIGLCIGVAFLLAAQGFISFGLILKLLIPFIIICIGSSILFDGLFDPKVTEKIKKTDFTNAEEIAAVFADERRTIDYEINDLVVDAVFGHITLDLVKAKVKKDTTIKISAIFGAVDLYVPDDVEVKVKANRIFGGVDKTVKETTKKTASTKTIYIDAVALFGGISIK